MMIYCKVLFHVILSILYYKMYNMKTQCDCITFHWVDKEISYINVRTIDQVINIIMYMCISILNIGLDMQNKLNLWLRSRISFIYQLIYNSKNQWILLHVYTVLHTILKTCVCVCVLMLLTCLALFITFQNTKRQHVLI